MLLNLQRKEIHNTMRELIESKYNCCGCTACLAVCPINAISMIEDEEGFLYPKIEETLCINCHKCEKVCPLKAGNHFHEPLKILGAKNKNDVIRSNSSSGGVFSIVADYVQSQGGVVYGAAFDESYQVKHMRAKECGEWKKFCISKYVQSDMNNIFQLVKKDLIDGKMVLFSGTPCQVDGLKHSLNGVICDKLITCDIVCHGVPSPKIWKDYLNYLTNHTGKKIGSVSFRDKKCGGWHNSRLTIKDENNQILLSETQRENFFFQLFVCHYILRPSCHYCQYANFHRPGDFTFGDFWGIEKNFTQFDDDKGVSLVMVNTKKGVSILENIQDRMDCFLVNQKQCTQPNLEQPSKENPNRGEFWRWYRNYGFRRIGQRMGYLPFNKLDKIILYIYRAENKLWRMLKKIQNKKI